MAVRRHAYRVDRLDHRGADQAALTVGSAAFRQNRPGIAIGATRTAGLIIIVGAIRRTDVVIDALVVGGLILAWADVACHTRAGGVGIRAHIRNGVLVRVATGVRNGADRGATGAISGAGGDGVAARAIAGPGCNSIAARTA